MWMACVCECVCVTDVCVGWLDGLCIDLDWPKCVVERRYRRIAWIDFSIFLFCFFFVIVVHDVLLQYSSDTTTLPHMHTRTTQSVHSMYLSLLGPRIIIIGEATRLPDKMPQTWIKLSCERVWALPCPKIGYWPLSFRYKRAFQYAYE